MPEVDDRFPVSNRPFLHEQLSCRRWWLHVWHIHEERHTPDGCCSRRGGVVLLVLIAGYTGVSVEINDAGHDPEPIGVDLPIRTPDFVASEECRYSFPTDQDVGLQLELGE